MEHAFDPFADLVQPAIQTGAVLIFLIGAARRPDQVVGLIEDASLPLETQKALVVKKGSQ